MPALSRELCGTHTFGGDSLAVECMVEPAGMGMVSACGSRVMFRSLLILGDSSAKMTTIRNICPWGYAAGQGMARFTLSRALYVAGATVGRTYIKLRHTMCLNLFVAAMGAGHVLTSLWRSIYACAFFFGEADVLVPLNNRTFLLGRTVGESSTMGAGISMLNAGAGMEGDGESSSVLNVILTEHLAADGQGTTGAHHRHYLDGMGIALPILKPGRSHSNIPIIPPGEDGPVIVIKGKENESGGLVTIIHGRSLS